MSINNRLITRGLGISHGQPGTSGMITRGLGGELLEVIIEAGRRIVRAGRSSKQRIEQIALYLKLIKINGVRVELPTMKTTAVLREGVNVTASENVVVETKESITVVVRHVRK